MHHLIAQHHWSPSTNASPDLIPSPISHFTTDQPEATHIRTPHNSLLRSAPHETRTHRAHLHRFPKIQCRVSTVVRLVLATVNHNWEFLIENPDLSPFITRSSDQIHNQPDHPSQFHRQIFLLNPLMLLIHNSTFRIQHHAYGHSSHIRVGPRVNTSISEPRQQSLTPLDHRWVRATRSSARSLLISCLADPHLLWVATRVILIERNEADALTSPSNGYLCSKWM